MKIICLIIATISLIFTAKCQDSSNVLLHYEQYPQLIGGYDSLIAANKSRLVLPKGCVDEGKSFIQFVINTDGTISDVKVIKGLDNCPKADSVGVKIVESVRYIPARINNQMKASQKVLLIPFHKKE